MNSDPLQQLRDIHLPADPGWWPPAPGWWLLGLLLLALLVYGGIKLYQAWQRRRPIRAARALHAQYTQALKRGELPPLEYANLCNALLKRLIVKAYGNNGLANQSGEAWLKTLDGISGENSFSQGAGRALGSERYRRQADIDGNALAEVIERLLRESKPGQFT